MSDFTTQNGLTVTCVSTHCLCHEKLKRPENVTPAAVAASDEEAWFDALCDAVDEYLRLYKLAQEATKAHTEAIENDMHEAKRNVIARFYDAGWDK